MSYLDRIAAEAEADLIAKPGHYDEVPDFAPWKRLGPEHEDLKARCEGRVPFSTDRDEDEPGVRDA